MFELILAAVLVGTMGKIADADGQSPILWGVVALLLTILCLMFVPLAFARVLLAGVLTFAAMTTYKIVKK